MKERILTALVLFGIVVGVLFFDPTGSGVRVLAVSALVAVSVELARLVKSQPIAFLIFTSILIGLFGFTIFNHVSPVLVSIGCFLLLLRKEEQHLIRPALGASLLLSGMSIAFLKLSLAKSELFPIILTAAIPIWAGDTAAIFAGKAFGKHKLAPSISPNKTWEGSIANLLAAIGAAAALGYFLKYPMDKMLLLGVSCGVIGQLGDLFESYLKRQAGVKDSGKLLPGHGGVFDRLDSLLMTAPFSYWILSSFLK